MGPLTASCSSSSACRAQQATARNHRHKRGAGTTESGSHKAQPLQSKDTEGRTCARAGWAGGMLLLPGVAVDCMGLSWVTALVPSSLIPHHLRFPSYTRRVVKITRAVVTLLSMNNKGRQGTTREEGGGVGSPSGSRRHPAPLLCHPPASAAP